MKSFPIQVHVDSISQFTEIRRMSAGTGFTSTGRIYNFILDRSDLKKRMRFLMQLSCENERLMAIRFADDIESQSLNQSYRGKSRPTDVLSFSAFAQNIELAKMGILTRNEFSLGDLSVCVPVCFVQAKEHRVSLSSELERMIVHGICHLKGFDHERSHSALAVMEGLEMVMRKAVVRQFGKPSWAKIAEAN